MSKDVREAMTKKEKYAEILWAATKLIHERQHVSGLIPVDATLISVRVGKGANGEDVCVNLGWLSEPTIDIGDSTYLLSALVDKPEYKDLVEEVLDVWYQQFSQAAFEVKCWGPEHSALETIYNSLKSGHPYAVFVPMFDAVFRDLGDLCDAEAVIDITSAGGKFAQFTAACHRFYNKERKPKAVDYDRELTDEDRLKAAKRLERIKRKMEEETQFKLSTTRKLRMQLNYLAKNRPLRLVLDVCGWVVPVEERAKGEFYIDMPWNKGPMTADEFHDYVTAQSKSIPVGWEYLYLIDKTLQSLR